MVPLGSPALSPGTSVSSETQDMGLGGEAGVSSVPRLVRHIPECSYKNL